MSCKVIDFSRETKRKKLKVKISEKLNKGKAWIIHNRDMLVMLTPIVIGGVTTVVKVVGKCMNRHSEKALKKLYCYDRSLGHFWRLKRELSTREWLEVDRRKKNGERMADILSDMRVLK